MTFDQWLLSLVVFLPLVGAGVIAALPKAQHALIGAPGSLRVIDEKTVYLRMPPSFMEAETCLMVLRNLMLAAHDRDLKGEPPPAPKVPSAPARKPIVARGA